ncbi:hypothetical protein HDF08_002310 [Edaphobacter lichenicola]|uniref:Uncharacterized protein n=1 Tax=Tunturiibacter lichenicola TaxID=2051959 RepID=A0A852VBH4_9BACT|nr:hypothetical protein [Edaphobacter lichenicola]
MQRQLYHGRLASHHRGSSKDDLLSVRQTDRYRSSLNYANKRLQIADDRVAAFLVPIGRRRTNGTPDRMCWLIPRIGLS